MAKRSFRKIKLAERKRPAQFPVDEQGKKAELLKAYPRLRRWRMHKERIIILMPCWNEKSNGKTPDMPECEIPVKINGQAILNPDGTPAKIYMPRRFHNGERRGGQVINLNAYMEVGAIKGGASDWVFAEILIEGRYTKDDWEIFQDLLTSLKDQVDSRSSDLVFLRGFLAELKLFLEHMKTVVSVEHFAMVEAKLRVPYGLANDALDNQSDGLAGQSLQLFQVELEHFMFRGVLHPISLYPVSKEDAFKALREGTLRRLKLRAGRCEKDSDFLTVVQDNPFKQTAATIALETFDDRERQQIAELLFRQEEANLVSALQTAVLLNQLGLSEVPAEAAEEDCSDDCDNDSEEESSSAPETAPEEVPPSEESEASI